MKLSFDVPTFADVDKEYITVCFHQKFSQKFSGQ